MTNAFGVWTAFLGTLTFVWGLSGSVRVATAVAGFLLVAGAVALLIDVGDDT